MLEIAINRAKNLPYQSSIEFYESPQDYIPFHDESFDTIVSEFIVYPSPKPTNITQNEMARVLVENSLLLIADVLYTGKPNDSLREQYKSLGLKYFCEATVEDFLY